MRSGFWWVNICNFVNKILGVFRTQLKLLIVGDQALFDLFILADKVVSLFRRAFVDGNFQSIFINHYAIQEVKNKQKEFAYSALMLMLKGLSIITILFLIVMTIGVKFCNQFFSNYFHYSASSGDIFLKFCLWLSPLIILIFAFAYLTALLNANKKFNISSPAPVIGNLGYIIILFLYAYKYVNWSISSVMIAGALAYAGIQTIFMFLFAVGYLKHSVNTQPEFQKDITKGIGINLIIPFSEVVVGFLALSIHSGTFAHIDYGHRYIYALFSIIAVPIATAIIPSLAKKNATNEKKEFAEEASSAFILTHILCAPFIFILYMYTEDVMMMMVKRIAAVKDKIGLCQNIAIISISLYFLMQNRILNTITNTASKINYSLYSSVIYGLSTIFFAFTLCKTCTYGLAWTGNLAYIAQFSYLLYVCLRDKLLIFHKSDYIYMITSLLYSYLGVAVFWPYLVKLSTFLFNKLSLSFCGINLVNKLIYGLPLVFITSGYLYFFRKYIKILFKK
jgi:peptidoglycan biosynthesis protein MviN/MurJ (putative lipid II flippase)